MVINMNQCPVIITKEGDQCSLKEGHSGPHTLELVALPIEKLPTAIAKELLALDFIREQDFPGVVFAIDKELRRQAAGEGTQ